MQDEIKKVQEAIGLLQSISPVLSQKMKELETQYDEMETPKKAGDEGNAIFQMTKDVHIAQKLLSESIFNAQRLRTRLEIIELG